jgi:hypothetical protein
MWLWFRNQSIRCIIARGHNFGKETRVSHIKRALATQPVHRPIPMFQKASNPVCEEPQGDASYSLGLV